METTEIRHVFGNAMRVAIPLTMRVRTLSDGVETETEEDFYPNLSYPIEIRLMRDGGYQKSYTPDVSGNVVTFTDDGTLPLGLYQVAVLCKGEATYRTLFPDGEMPHPGKQVVGVTPAIVGSVEASQVLQLVCGYGEPLIDRIWTIDLRTMQSFTIDIH